MVPFDDAVTMTEAWIDEMAREADLDDIRAETALSKALVAVRDRLAVHEASTLGTALPLLLRGAYFESWRPLHAVPDSDKQDFLLDLAHRLSVDVETAEEIARAAFRVLERRLPPPQITAIRGVLPGDFAELWATS